MKIVWKPLRFDVARFFNSEPDRTIIREEQSLSGKVGSSPLRLSVDYKPTNQLAAKEIAFTEYLVNQENILNRRGYHIGSLFSDQTYRWN